jgi:hypothetical protein
VPNLSASYPGPLSSLAGKVQVDFKIVAGSDPRANNPDAFRDLFRSLLLEVGIEAKNFLNAIVDHGLPVSIMNAISPLSWLTVLRCNGTAIESVRPADLERAAAELERNRNLPVLPIICQRRMCSVPIQPFIKRIQLALLGRHRNVGDHILQLVFLDWRKKLYLLCFMGIGDPKPCDSTRQCTEVP